MNFNQENRALIVSQYIDEKYRDNYYRKGISMFLYKKFGTNSELLGKIKELLESSIITNQKDYIIVSSFMSHFNLGNSVFEIPYDSKSYYESIEFTKNICQDIIIPLRTKVTGLNAKSIELIDSIESLILNINPSRFNQIFIEPFNNDFSPKSFMEKEGITEEDFPLQAKDEWLLSVNLNSFYFQILISMNELENDCSELIHNAFAKTGNYYKPYTPVIATDLYGIVKQLPSSFIKAFWRSIETDVTRLSQIISSLETNQKNEFVKLFHGCDTKVFGERYYSFLLLALEFFRVFTLESTLLPRINKYIDCTHKCVGAFCSLVNDFLFSSISEPVKPFQTEILEFDDTFYKRLENLSFCSSEVYTESQNNELKTEIKYDKSATFECYGDSKEKKQVSKDIPCYLLSDTIHKRFDVSKLVTLLTSKNEFADKSYVELGEDNNQSLKDCLTYFLFPDDKNIKNKIENHEFNVKFKLRWKGRHAVSLRCLVRLLLNADIKKWAKALDVFDLSGKEDDRLSREYVSVQDDKSPIWKPVTEVFGKKAIYNAGIDKEASDKTIKANEKEIKEIINIVFACKK